MFSFRIWLAFQWESVGGMGNYGYLSKCYNRLVNDFIENLRFVNSVKANARVIILMKSTQSYLSALFSGPSLHAKGPSSRTLKVI